MSGRSLRAGLCGIGLESYWSQFAGLEKRLHGYLTQFAARLVGPGVEVVELGLIDTAQRSREAGHQCRSEDIDVLFLYVTTYALSNTVLPLVQRAGVPVIVLNLQPAAAIDYEAFNKLEDRTAMTGEWLAFCSACPVPEMANVLKRARIPFHQVTGVLDEPATWREIAEWLAAARVRSTLAEARLGLMGHYYSGMLDIMTDVTLVSIVFGSHVELVEVDELSALAAEVNESALVRRVAAAAQQLLPRAKCRDLDQHRPAVEFVGQRHRSLFRDVARQAALRLLDEVRNLPVTSAQIVHDRRGGERGADFRRMSRPSGHRREFWRGSGARAAADPRQDGDYSASGRDDFSRHRGSVSGDALSLAGR